MGLHSYTPIIPGALSPRIYKKEAVIPAGEYLPGIGTLPVSLHKDENLAAGFQAALKTFEYGHQKNRFMAEAHHMGGPIEAAQNHRIYFSHHIVNEIIISPCGVIAASREDAPVEHVGFSGEYRPR